MFSAAFIFEPGSYDERFQTFGTFHDSPTTLQKPETRP